MPWVKIPGESGREPNDWRWEGGGSPDSPNPASGQPGPAGAESADWFAANAPTGRAREEFPDRQRREPEVSDDDIARGGVGDLRNLPRDFPPYGTEPWNRGKPESEWTAENPATGSLEKLSATAQRYTAPLGWEQSKLDRGHQSVKYDFLRSVQDLGLTGTTARNNLQRVVEAMRARYPNARVTSDDKIDFGDGYGPIDVIDRNGQFVWLPDRTAGQGQAQRLGQISRAGGADAFGDGDGVGGADLASYGDFIRPWAQRFAYPGWTPPQPFTDEFAPPDQLTEPFDYPAYTAPAWTDRFVPPTAESIYDDPGIQFELAEGQKALERSAAARGTLLTGGTLKDLSQYRQGLAATRYGDVYGRRVGEYGQRYGEFSDQAARERGAYDVNLGTALQRYGSRRDISQDAFNRALTTYGQRRSLADEARGRSREEFDVGYGKARNEYDLARDIFYQNQDRPWRKLFSLAELGRF